MKRVLLACILLGLGFLGYAYRNAIAPPVQRDLVYHPARWPAGEPPVRLIFLSDLHAVEPDMPASRIAKLVARINALKPDCVLMAGDFTSDKRLSWRSLSADEAAAPLAGLRPRIASFAVLGNNEHKRGVKAIRAALTRAGIKVLVNDAARCGALAIAGLDDAVTDHEQFAPTRRAVARIGGIPILLSHTPAIMPWARGFGLTLAGHTHCGQLRIPGIIEPSSRRLARYRCGLVREQGRVLVVTAGIGTSILPLRLNAPADFWVITVGPGK